MSTIKGLSEAHKLVLAEIEEARRQGYAEGFEAGKLVAEQENSLNKVTPKFEVNS